ncbi:hypothetical protein RB595_001651 [Gaeumannomyces hyphopodioides]
MPLASHAVWSLVGATAYLAAMANAAGVLDVGLVFPRANETYEPSDQFPFIWASQNDNIAKYLDFALEYRIFNTSNGTDLVGSGRFQHWPSDFGENRSDLRFFWRNYKLEFEGPVSVAWSGSWAECGEVIPGTASSRKYASHESSNLVMDFELKRGGQKVDLVAATSNPQECPDQGFTISVTDETSQVNIDNQGLSMNATCAMLVHSPSPTPIANPCRVSIDKSAAESIEAAILKHRCGVGRQVLGDNPANCPKEDHASRQLAVAGIATVAAVTLGAIGFLLA